MKNKRGWLGAIFILVVLLVVILLFSYIIYLFFSTITKDGENSTKSKSPIVITNPVNSIKNSIENKLNNSEVNSSNNLNETNSSEDLIINESEIINQAVLNFNESYIDYILFGLGCEKLHSGIGFGNPIIETVVDNEEFTSEIIDKIPRTAHANFVNNSDIKIKISKDIAIKSLLSNDIKLFIKDSVKNNNIEIEKVAGDVELFSKGYLDLYKELSSNNTE